MQREFIKIFTAILIIFCMTGNPVFAGKTLKFRGMTDESFSLKQETMPKIVSYKLAEAKTIPNIITIPENSTITAEVINAQKELRWHKSGFILCKLLNYTPEGVEIPLDVSDKEIYLTVRKYEPLNKKEAGILTAELIIFEGASVFAPGVDIGYFFIKGAIQRKKHPNWFKAGVYNAYDNSICWFWLKGKSIELEQDNLVNIKNIKADKVEKLSRKIDKRYTRFERQSAKRIGKQICKTVKRNRKNLKQNIEYDVLNEIIAAEIIDNTILVNTEN